MLKLFKFGQVGEAPDASPFCVKVEAYLRLAGIPYETFSGSEYLRKAPKGKLPFIEDDGKLIPDSSFIIEYIRETYGDQVDAQLSDADKAVAHAFIKMIDENLYWVLVHARWQPERNLPVLRKLFFNSFPFPLNYIIAYTVRKGMLSQLYKQGMGRHSDAEITEIGNRDLQALSAFLGGKAYFFGDKPCSLDATAYAVLVLMLRVPQFSAPIADKAKSYPNLVEFTERFHARYFRG